MNAPWLFRGYRFHDEIGIYALDFSISVSIG